MCNKNGRRFRERSNNHDRSLDASFHGLPSTQRLRRACEASLRCGTLAEPSLGRRKTMICFDYGRPLASPQTWIKTVHARGKMTKQAIKRVWLAARVFTVVKWCISVSVDSETWTFTIDVYGNLTLPIILALTRLPFLSRQESWCYCRYHTVGIGWANSHEMWFLHTFVR
jgi:hypothetical protein